MANRVIDLELTVRFTARKTVTEADIRSFVTGFRAQAETKLQSLVASAPVAAQAVYNSTTYCLEVLPEPPVGEWLMELILELDVDTADTVTQDQVHDFLAPYFDDAMGSVRTVMAAAPPSAQIRIVDWHVHRLTGPTNEIEA